MLTICLLTFCSASAQNGICEVGELASNIDCDGVCDANDEAGSVDCNGVCDANDALVIKITLGRPLMLLMRRHPILHS
jgi:hypothetical protein